MAKIKILKQGETQVLPRTVAEAVNTDSGLSVQAELDALKESTPDVSAQITAHNTNPSAHEDIRGLVSDVQQDLTEHTENKSNPHQVTAAQVSALPLSGGTLTGTLILSGNPTNTNDATTKTYVDSADATTLSSAKSYTDEKIIAIPTPDVSGQIETHNTSPTAHTNMHWVTSVDEELSEVLPGEPIDAATLQGHPASYFATKDDLYGIGSGEGGTSVDLSNYVTNDALNLQLQNYALKTEVQTLTEQLSALTTRVTSIESEISGVATKIDEINGEVI